MALGSPAICVEGLGEQLKWCTAAAAAAAAAATTATLVRAARWCCSSDLKKKGFSAIENAEEDFESGIKLI